MLKARLIALHLPQFHPIPENDEWWGKGFTEWTNVAKAKPLFIGHQQPNFPADLGFYDLRVPESRHAQAEMARVYGVEGFCYWHYWFGGGRRLLERPLAEILESGEPDFPFCLAWANHTWSGVWHGCPDRVLIEQTYPGLDDVIAHFYAMLPAFRDPRYLKIDGKNIFSIYRPLDLVEPRRFMDTWRELAQKEGLGGFHFIAITDYPWEMPDHGYDACTANPPVAMLTRQGAQPLNEGIEQEMLKYRFFSQEKPQLPKIYSYESFVENAFPEATRRHDFYPCAVPNWDNTPRSGANGFVLHGSTPELYGRHLREAVSLVADRAPEQRVVFIKSWNEWAETNYLEPDLKWGHRYLEETLRAVTDEAPGTPVQEHPMKVHFLNVRTTHHSPHSGYDRYLDYIPHEPVPESEQWRRMPEEERQRLYREAKERISWYNPPDLEMETDVNALNPALHKHVCHFLYGENSIFHIRKSTNPRKKIFVSFHQPPEAHQQFIRTREPLAAIDGIIVVGTNQIPFFEQYVDRSKIFFVPHGVDTEFFQPDPAVPKDPHRVLFVGNWLRDFDTLVKVAGILAAKAPEVRIDVVTLERNKPLFDGCGNVSFFSGIPEEELLLKYQGASLLMVPMKDCTANNSVLEGMSCGLPIVTTDIGGIRDYVNERCAVLCRPADAEQMAREVLDLFADRQRMEALGRSSRKMAEPFTWERVSDLLVQAYRESFESR